MNERPFHILKPNKAQTRPQHVIFFDTETSPFPLTGKETQQLLRLGWACYWRRGSDGHTRNLQWQPFTDRETFWEFVEKYIYPKKKLYIVAHNIPFDWRVCQGFWYAKTNDWKLKSIYTNEQTTLIHYQVRGGSVVLLDTGNFFRVSLRELGDMVGLPKLTVDFDQVDDETLSTYCKRDVEILVKAWGLWLDFIDEHDLGNFKPTLASQAFTAYRHRFMKGSITIHGAMDVCLLERSAYHGGRTECFRVGRLPEEPYTQLDVNSMYAFQMMIQEYPYAVQGFRPKLDVEKLKELLGKFCVVAQVDVETEIPAFPAKKGKRVVYPVGRFTTTLTTPELKFALEQCQIHAVKAVAWYAKAPIFADYARYFSDLKEHYSETGNGPFRAITKLFANTLYGKFGQRGLDVKVKDKPEPYGLTFVRTYNNRTGVVGRSYRLGDDYIEEEQTAESYNSFPAIAAHVTAYGRMYLWELFNVAGQENTFYMDTDCLIVNQEGYDRLTPLLDEHKLGHLKIEAVSNELEIRAPKDYRIGDKNRLKGIKASAQEVSPGVFDQDEFLGLMGSITCGFPDLVTTRRVTRVLEREIKSGTVQPNGWVTPFRFPL